MAFCISNTVNVILIFIKLIGFEVRIPVHKGPAIPAAFADSTHESALGPHGGLWPVNPLSLY
jgi:hypothetical protein